MHQLAHDRPGQTLLLMGNEALARGVIEAGATVCAAYPGNPSSDIIEALAKTAVDLDIHVEWSVNEKVALEVAASAAMTGLRGMAAMKQNGLNVASDFLLNLNLSGVRGGLVLLICDDPSGISSTNEQDSRLYARMGELPLLEPSDFQEAKDVVPAAFDLSEELGLPILVHSVTRLSHARGNVTLGPLPRSRPRPWFDRSRPFVNVPMPALAHQRLKDKIESCKNLFERSQFNSYSGPEKPELMILSTGAGLFYAKESIQAMNITRRVGLIKLTTTFPLPESFLIEHLKKADRLLVIEEGGPFLESQVKELCTGQADKLGRLTVIGKTDGRLPGVGELNPDLIIAVLADLLGLEPPGRPSYYLNGLTEAVDRLIPQRDLAFCAGCPHRATYWAVKKALIMDGRDGFVLGDIGCYGMGSGPAGFGQMNTMQAMGSGAGLASGMGLLEFFGLDQPVVAVCGDSTFFHSAIPALINARQHGAKFLFLILDNDATAMTGFQPHPGLGRTATGESAPAVSIEGMCRAMGFKVKTADPYDLNETTRAILDGLEGLADGPRVLILKRACALVRAKQGPPDFQVRVDPSLCLGQECGCSRLCTRVFKCPGLFWDVSAGKAAIDEATCTGCGVCAQICPQGAIINTIRGEVGA